MNDNPFAPWNGYHKDDPTAAWNNPMYRDDPFAPWNSPFGHKEDYDRYEREHSISPYHSDYGKY